MTYMYIVQEFRKKNHSEYILHGRPKAFGIFQQVFACVEKVKVNLMLKTPTPAIRGEFRTQSNIYDAAFSR